MVKITCRFIHKSVREYYAACFIKQKPDLVAEKLYLKLFSHNFYWKFSQEVKFLAEIDRYRYEKHGVLPYLKKLFDVSEPAFQGLPNPEHILKIREIIESIHLHCQIGGRKFGFGVQIIQFGPLTALAQPPFEVWIVDAIFNPEIPYPVDLAENTEEKFVEMPLLKAYELYKSWWGNKYDILKASSQIATILFNAGRNALAHVNSEEAMNSVLEL